MARIGVPFAATGQRTDLEVRPLMAHDPPEPVPHGVVDSVSHLQERDRLRRHEPTPLAITAASCSATGAEQTPRWTSA